MTNRSEEFVRLKEISGWTQARIARELDLDPSTVSLVMNHRCQPSLTVLRLFSLLICVVNLFLGWTFIGWVVSLAWAFTAPRGKGF